MKDFLKVPANIGLKVTITSDKAADVLVKFTDKDTGTEIINQIIKAAKDGHVRVAAFGAERSLMIESYPVTSGVTIKQSFSFIRPRNSEVRNYNTPKWWWHPGGTSAQQTSSTESGAFLLLEGDTNGTAFVLQQEGAGKIKLQNSD